MRYIPRHASVGSMRLPRSSSSKKSLTFAKVNGSYWQAWNAGDPHACLHYQQTTAVYAKIRVTSPRAKSRGARPLDQNYDHEASVTHAILFPRITQGTILKEQKRGENQKGKKKKANPLMGR